VPAGNAGTSTLVLKEPVELARAFSISWLSKVMETLWLEPKLLPDTRIKDPTGPLEGEMDAEANGVGVG